MVATASRIAGFALESFMDLFRATTVRFLLRVVCATVLQSLFVIYPIASSNLAVRALVLFSILFVDVISCGFVCDLF